MFFFYFLFFYNSSFLLSNFMANVVVYRKITINEHSCAQNTTRKALSRKYWARLSSATKGITVPLRECLGNARGGSLAEWPSRGLAIQRSRIRVSL